MDVNSLNVLEYQSLLEMLAAKALSTPGKTEALALKPTLSPQEVLVSWDLSSEAQNIIVQKGLPSLGDHLTLNGLLEVLDAPGAILNPQELRLVWQEIQTIQNVKSFFVDLPDIAPKLFEIVAKLAFDLDLLRRLTRSIGSEGEVLDTASAALGSLRAEHTSTRQGLIGKLNEFISSPNLKNIIQDDLVTDRGGRFVIPVKAASLHHVPGMVHDWSKSESTAFVEPLETVADNNKLSLIKRREKEEIERILTDLSQRCKNTAPDILESGQILTLLDLYLAKARLANTIKAIKPKYQPGQGVNLIEARHPILDRRLAQKEAKMTPLDLKLTPEKKILIVSGLNAGGKTVALKTLGLLVLMAKTGLMIPVKEDSSLDLFTNILVVIGDEQDLSADLSTFSGHIKSLVKVFKEAGSNSLVLLDELGSGTDPGEGAALALAVLNTFIKTSSYVVSATHYQQVKAWAVVTKEVLIAAVNTGEDGRPVYGLDYGRPGFSGGLSMARRLGLNSKLVDLAEEFLDDGQRETNSLLAKLDAQRASLALVKENYHQQNAILAQAQIELKNERERLISEHKQATIKQDREIKLALSKAGKEFLALKEEMQKFKENNFSWDKKKISWDLQKSKISKDLRTILPVIGNDESFLDVVTIGQRVLVRKLGKIGRVTEVERNNILVEADGISIKTTLEDLYEAPKIVKKEKSYFNYTVTTRDMSLKSLNLIGKTVDEALPEVEKYLDQASLFGEKKLIIIHGLGTGRLRKSIRSFLQKHPLVKDFKGLEGRAGGEGVTEVNLFK